MGKRATRLYLVYTHKAEPAFGIAWVAVRDIDLEAMWPGPSVQVVSHVVQGIRGVEIVFEEIEGWPVSLFEGQNAGCAIDRHLGGVFVG